MKEREREIERGERIEEKRESVCIKDLIVLNSLKGKRERWGLDEGIVFQGMWSGPFWLWDTRRVDAKGGKGEKGGRRRKRETVSNLQFPK